MREITRRLTALLLALSLLAGLLTVTAAAEERERERERAPATL